MQSVQEDECNVGLFQSQLLMAIEATFFSGFTIYNFQLSISIKQFFLLYLEESTSR